MKGVHEWIDLPSLESIDLGMNSLLGRYNIPECALTMKSMNMMNSMDIYHIDLPNLSRICSNGNGFCRPRTVILESNERINCLTDVDIPKCHNIRLFNSFQKVQSLEINSMTWLDVSHLLDISHDLAQVVYQSYLPALNNS